LSLSSFTSSNSASTTFSFSLASAFSAPAVSAAPGAAGGDATPDLTEEQLEQVRALALEKAQQLKLAPDKAELLADSLVGSLATA